MATLDRISVSGFKSLAAVEVDLRPINVLIGANGSGKSNFLGVFEFLAAIGAGRLYDYVARAGGADKLLHFGSRTTPVLSIRVSFGPGTHPYGIDLEADDADGLYPSKDSSTDPNREDAGGSYRSGVSSDGGEAGFGESAPEPPAAGRVRNRFDHWLSYHFHDTSFHSPMKKTADVNDNRRLRPDGANLAAFLYLLREKHAGKYDLIRRTVRLAAPFFDDFVLEPLELNEDKILLGWRHKGWDERLNASSFSDGALRFVALATLLLQPVSCRPPVIFLDEPELGLHPYAITLLASLVQQASVDTQIVLATQSPILLDRFDPEDVIVADRVRGATEFTRLDGKALKKWLKEYSLGELWEKNDLGGRPAPENGGGKWNERGE